MQRSPYYQRTSDKAYWDDGDYVNGYTLKDGYSYDPREGYSQVGTEERMASEGGDSNEHTKYLVPVYGRMPTSVAPAPAPAPAAAAAPPPAEVKPRVEAPAFDIRSYMQQQDAKPAASRPAADINPTLFNSVSQWDQSRFGRKAADGSTDNTPELFNQTRDWSFRGDRERNTDSSTASAGSSGSAGPANGYARFFNEDNGASQAWRSAPGGTRRQDEPDGASASASTGSQRRQRMSGSREFLDALNHSR